MVQKAINYADENRNLYRDANHTAPIVPLDAGNYFQCAHVWAARRFLPIPITGPYQANDDAAEAKKPMVNGWESAPLSKWKGYLAAMSRPHGFDKLGRWGADDRRGTTIGIRPDKAPRPFAVVDLDDPSPDALERALQIFGDTPLIIKSPNGWHLYYLNPHNIGPEPHASELLPWDLKTNGYVVAPLSYGIAKADRVKASPWGYFKATQYEWYNPPLDFFHAPDLEKLKAIAAILEAGELPVLDSASVANVWTPRPTVEPFQTVTTKTVTARIQNPEKLPQSNQNHLGYEGKADIGEGERNKSLFEHMMRTAAPLSKLNSSPPAFMEAAHLFNETRCLPQLPRSEVETTARSAWKIHSEGRNQFKPLRAEGVSEAIKAIRLPQKVRGHLIEAWGTRKAKSVYSESLAPLLRAVLYYNGTQAHFRIENSFVYKNTTTSCHKMAGRFKHAFQDAGLIEVVPARISGFDLEWQRPNKKGEGGRSKLYRFTRRGKTLLAETVATHTLAGPKDMSAAVKSLLAETSDSRRLDGSQGHTNADAKRYNGKAKARRERHKRATLLALMADNTDKKTRATITTTYNKTFKDVGGKIEGFESTPLIEHPINLNTSQSPSCYQSGRNNSTDRLRIALNRLESLIAHSDVATLSSLPD